MKLQSVELKKLFGLFDYNIDLNNEEDLTLLTGPNGYGIIYDLNMKKTISDLQYYAMKINVI